MRKKIVIIFVFLIIFIFLFAFLSNTYAADTPGEGGYAESELNVRGSTCGIADPDNPNSRKTYCCMPEDEIRRPYKQIEEINIGDPKDSSGSESKRLCAVNMMGYHTVCADQIVDPFFRFLLENTPVGYTLNALWELRQTTFRPCDTGVPMERGEVLRPGQPPSGPYGVHCRCVSANADTRQLCEDYLGHPENEEEMNEFNKCLSCSANGVWTGMGCIYTGMGDFIQKTLFGTAVGFAGLAALICIFYSALTLQISQGNPEKIKKAKENLTSCIIGLLLIIFSILILKVIGVDILQIPGFSTG